MGSAVLQLPRDVCEPSAIGSLGAFFESPSARQAKLHRKEEKLIKGLSLALDTYLLDVVGSRSLSEFCKRREKQWPRYVRALRALQDTVSNLIPDDVIEQISREVIAELDGDLQKNSGRLRFGTTLTEQARFTLWTIQKIRVLGRQISEAGDVPPEKREDDLGLLRDYRVSSLWAQFHLDSLIAAMKFNKRISKEIHAPICEGLRAVVNAYAIMKDALALRIPRMEKAPVADLPWDEEDERLLASSMRDVNADFSSDS